MRCIVIASLTITLGGCGYNLPNTNSVNMTRVLGQGVAVTPLTTEPGDIWPGPLKAPKTLEDLERESPGSMQPEAPTKGSPLSRGANPLLAPVPSTAPGAQPDTSSAPAPGQTQADRRIIVPKGNGTSTVIYPDGRIETIPTPK
jgi:hypothetical protein